MRETAGMCSDLGNCLPADAAPHIRTPAGAQFACRECGNQLTEVAPRKHSRMLLLMLARGGLILAATFCASFSYFWLEKTPPLLKAIGRTTLI